MVRVWRAITPSRRSVAIANAIASKAKTAWRRSPLAVKNANGITRSKRIVVSALAIDRLNERRSCPWNGREPPRGRRKDHSVPPKRSHFPMRAGHSRDQSISPAVGAGSPRCAGTALKCWMWDKEDHAGLNRLARWFRRLVEQSDGRL